MMNYLSEKKGFLRLPQVLELIPVCKSTWWEGIADGRFPEGIKISTRVTAWKAEDIFKLIEQLGAQDKISNGIEVLNGHGNL